MPDISVGAVGAAVVAGLVSILGLIIGKEQKVSEFRQAWIDELRKCFVAYLVNINAIVDTVRLQKTQNAPDKSILAASYKALNEASHGIILRVNAKEKTAKTLLKSMGEFEAIASANETMTVEKIRAAEKDFLIAAKKLLKFEWKRVKRGENIFVWTKWIVLCSTVAMLSLLIYIWLTGSKSPKIQHKSIDLSEHV